MIRKLFKPQNRPSLFLGNPSALKLLPSRFGCSCRSRALFSSSSGDLFDDFNFEGDFEAEIIPKSNENQPAQIKLENIESTNIRSLYIEFESQRNFMDLAKFIEKNFVFFNEPLRFLAMERMFELGVKGLGRDVHFVTNLSFYLEFNSFLYENIKKQEFITENGKFSLSECHNA